MIELKFRDSRPIYEQIKDSIKRIKDSITEVMGDSSKVTIDDKGLEEYYKENTNSIALPETMTVRLVGNLGQTTAIGTLDTRTGEVTFGDWYTMDGRRLAAKPTKKGVYIHNGKKVAIK